MKIFEEKKWQKFIYLSPCQLNGKNLEIFLRSPVGATEQDGGNLNQ